MRDGARLVIDVYRPEAPGRFPALVAFGIHTKEIQGPDYPADLVRRSPPGRRFGSAIWKPATRVSSSRAAMSISSLRRAPSGKSDSGGSREWDAYDLIEWAAGQPWCDGNIGMVGIGAFAAEQWRAAKQNPPHLKAIFPYDPRGAYGPLGGFREDFPGGVMQSVSLYYRIIFPGAIRAAASPAN